MNLKKALKIGSIALVGSVAPITIGLGLGINHLDNPISIRNIKYSTNNSKPANLIEIFSDGLDYRVMKEFLDDRSVDTFNEFGIVKRYVSLGTKTHYTVPLIFGDWKEFNYFKYWKKSKTSDFSFTDFSYRNQLSESGVQHMNDVNVPFKKHLVLPINLTADSKFYESSIGSPRSILKRNNSINVVNFPAIRDLFAKNGWGVAKLSQAGAAYKFLLEGERSDDNPARVLIQDMITHLRYNSGENYEFLKKTNSLRDAGRMLSIYLKRYFDKLKSIKDPKTGLSAFDNSMIVIYGDHGSHDLPNKEGDIDRKRNSLFLIKYPNKNNRAKQNQPEYLNNTVLKPQFVKEVIKDYYKNENNYLTNPFNFLKTNQNFIGTQQHPITFINDEGYETQFRYSANGTLTSEYITTGKIIVDLNFNYDDDWKQKLESYFRWKP